MLVHMPELQINDFVLRNCIFKASREETIAKIMTPMIEINPLYMQKLQNVNFVGTF